MQFIVMRNWNEEDHRVAVTPADVGGLCSAGHQVRVQAGAGLGSGYADEEYARAGCKVINEPTELYQAPPGVLFLLDRPSLTHVESLPDSTTLAGFLNLEVCDRELLSALVTKKVTALDLGQFTLHGERPVLHAVSELAGRLAPQLAARWLETDATAPGRRRGIVLGGLPGGSAAEVVVLGAGTLGVNAARGFAALGAQVTLLDRDSARLRHLEGRIPGRVALVHATQETVARSTRYADVVVGAVHAPGERSPLVLTESDVRSMRAGAVILDFAITHGGCVETARPTSFSDPVYEEHGVLHCCLPNATALVARTASQAISYAFTRFLAQQQEPLSYTLTMRADHPLCSAVVIRNGQLIQPALLREWHGQSKSSQRLGRVGAEPNSVRVKEPAVTPCKPVPLGEF